MNVSIRQLSAFVQVARLRSFTRAAEQLHITQAGLSSMMRELEAQLGFRLLNRTTRSVALTPAGERFYPVAAQFSEQLAGTVEAIDQWENQRQKKVRVACTPMLASTLLPFIHNAFGPHQAEIAVEYSDAEATQILARLDEGSIDCGIGFFYKPIAGYARTLICQTRLIYVRAPARAARRSSKAMAPLRWEDLLYTPLLRLESHSAIQQAIDKQLTAIGRSPHAQNSVVLSHIETVLAMAASGAGGAILPSLALERCRQYQLETFLLEEPPVNVGVYLITDRGRIPRHGDSEACSALIQSIRSFIDER